MNMATSGENQRLGSHAIARSTTPHDLVITSRNRHFGGCDMLRSHWLGGDPFGTAFFNALSVTFPLGETFFINVLKAYINKTPEKLSKEIRAFIHQEAVHSREHIGFNEQIKQANYDIAPLEQRLSEVMDRIKTRSATDQLIATICLEHLTAILAREFIANPAHLKDADEDQRNLWLWHASEEIEHKGVAYDTWLYVTKDWSRLRRWAAKSVFMAKISSGFLKNRIAGMMELLRQDGITGTRARLGAFKYGFISPGPVTAIFWSWLKFFLPGFHPWNEDDRDLIQLAESEYEAAIMSEIAPRSNVMPINNEKQDQKLRKVA